MQLAQSFYTLLVFALFLPWTLMVQLLIMLIVSSGLNITSSMSNEWIKLSDWSCWNMNALGFHNTIFIDQGLRKKVTGGWDPTCTKRSFFPFWRSVLGSRGNVRVYPSYAAPDENMVLDVELLRKSEQLVFSYESCWVNRKNSATDKYSSIKKVQYSRIQSTCESAKECMSRKVCHGFSFSFWNFWICKQKMHTSKS